MVFVMRRSVLITAGLLLTLSGCGGAARSKSPGASPADGSTARTAAAFAPPDAVGIEFGDTSSASFKALRAISTRTVAKPGPDFITSFDGLLFAQGLSLDGVPNADELGQARTGLTAIILLPATDPVKAYDSILSYDGIADRGAAVRYLEHDYRASAHDGSFQIYAPKKPETTWFFALSDTALLGASSLERLHDAITRGAGDSPSLADDAAFGSEIARTLPDAAATIWTRSMHLAEALARFRFSSYGSTAIFETLAGLGDVTLSVSAPSNAVKLQVVSASVNPDFGLGDPYEPKLPGASNDVACGFVDFRNLGPMLRGIGKLRLGAPEDTPFPIGTIEAATGASFDSEIAPLISGEVLAAAAECKNALAGSLTLAPPDPDASMATINRIHAGLDRSDGLQRVEIDRVGSSIVLREEPGDASGGLGKLGPDFESLRKEAPKLVTSLAYLGLANARATDVGVAALQRATGVLVWTEHAGDGLALTLVAQFPR